MTLGKEIKELKNIYIYGCTMALGVGGREFFRPWIVRGVLDRTAVFIFLLLFFIFFKINTLRFFLQIWHPATGSTSGMNIQLDERMAGAL